VTAELRDVGTLPEAVVRHLVHAGVADAPIPPIVRIRQTGDIRLRPDQRRAPQVALLRITPDPPGFVREARVKTSPLVTLRAHDEFFDGVARAQVWPFRSWKSVDDTGPEVDQDALVRFMSAMAWFPAAMRMPYVAWESGGPSNATMSVTIGGTLAHAALTFDEAGALVALEADRFHRLASKQWELAGWTMTYGETAVMSGVRVPASASASWELAKGSFSYIRFDVEDLSYD
jgi:hypothetical protein